MELQILFCAVKFSVLLEQFIKDWRANFLIARNENIFFITGSMNEFMNTKSWEEDKIIGNEEMKKNGYSGYYVFSFEI